ncbi:MAG: spore coat protein CotJB [Lachnospiraceae bacterium]|nr:spore coat protein CotJB [Lachnospiraceae bacterium]
MHNMNKKELFNFISQVSFMLDDITLFLNTHPDCEDAISAYNQFKEMRREAVFEYTENYGPLNRYDVNACNYWDWVNKPWPWEGECGC